MTSEQLLFQFAETTTYSADQFLIFPGNREAHRWITSADEWPSHALVLTGPPRSGKTHLTHIWAAAHDAQIVQASRLTQENVPEFAGGNLAIEGADGISDERALFHLYNLVRENGGLLLMTARLRPAAWNIELPDLSSRVAATPQVAIGALDHEMAGPLILKLAADRQLSISPPVVQYLSTWLDRTYAACEDAVTRLDRAAVREGRKVSRQLAEQELGLKSGREGS
ncbi:MAG: chromosomal replication initiator DnaA [Minwuia sp.]|uniref:chromosomal replication initiator DnaA n=1 Tax=Minwuia sp. TaxID=2493630 RepID=UPI003A875122